MYARSKNTTKTIYLKCHSTLPRRLSEKEYLFGTIDIIFWTTADISYTITQMILQDSGLLLMEAVKKSNRLG